ncbi:P22 phage major capsid protein family protein [Bifidobacterium vansinderenii]|uniref:Capsid protein n=1 Tax=Bifidobacterium vansinderenii TaxID=1984871 RepID=A0A229W0V5_9BIFI|nr:P22 phage major capsid protein family protein [Bifidobacterium vansinderenii]OXN01475.1 hypothetical protein Tam10B_0478 [Bifidobacterium vansinderenii]
MAITNFIPEIWSASILENFHKQSVITQLANRQYEGELRTGNKIHIPGIVDITIKDYKANKRTTTPDEVQDTGIELDITEEKNFDFYVDDIDQAQAGRSFAEYTTSAGIGLVDDAEAFLTKKLIAEGTAIAGAGQVTTWTEAYNAVLAVRKAMNDALAPKTERYLIVNSAFEMLLLSDGSKLTSFDKSGMTDGLREASIGRLVGFTVLESDYIADQDTPIAIGLWKPALAYVSQINSTEALRSQDKFADRVRGLHVYGGKVIRPKAVQVYTSTTAPKG